MRILYISNLYPNPLFPDMATFNRQQLSALGELCEIDVISPVPWTACLKRKPPAPCRTEDGIIIHHPVYYYTPCVFRAFYGTFFLNSIQSTASRLLENKKYDIIYSSWLYPDSWAAAKLAQQYGVPLFVKVHGSDVNLLQPGTAITRQSMAVVEQAQRVICVSRALQDRLMGLGAPDGKFEVLYNGVDHSIFHPMDRIAVRHNLGISNDVYVVLFVGNLKKDKGLVELMDAFGTYQNDVAGLDARLVIIGNGPHGAHARRQMKKLGLSKQVVFLGSQPLTVIARWMNAASVLCLPSYMEGVPNVVLEALACGTRVVATTVGGIPELNNGDGSMLLIPPQDTESLAHALKIAVGKQYDLVPNDRIASWKQNAQKLYAVFTEQS